MSEHNYMRAETKANADTTVTTEGLEAETVGTIADSKAELVLSPEEIEKHNKKILRAVVRDIAVCFAVGIVALVGLYIMVGDRLTETLITRGLERFAFILIALVFVTLSIAYHVYEYKTLKKASLSEKITRIKMQKKMDIAIRTIIPLFMCTALFLGFITEWNFDSAYATDAINKLNFPTVTEIFPQKDEDISERSQTWMIIRSNFVAPTVYHFSQRLGATRIRVPTDASFLYDVSYYELHNEWLAARYEHELRSRIGTNEAANIIVIEVADKIEMDIQGFDSAIYYLYFFRVCFYEECEECEALGIRHFAENLILRAGNTVITVRYEGSKSLLDSINQGRVSR